MDVLLIILILLFWIFLIVLHHFLEGYEFISYLTFTREFGVSINYYSIKFFFPNFRRKLFKNTKNKLFFYFYKLGTLLTCLTIPIACFIVFITMKTMIKQVLNNLFMKTNIQDENDYLSLKPVFPGINLPFNHLPFFLFSLAIVTFIHEYGHAIAANLLDIRVFNTGLSFYFLLPVAFVQMSSDDIEKTLVKKRLIVAAAGIWNNYVLTLFCLSLLTINPLLFSLFYNVNQGVYIYDVNLSSSISGNTGLVIGDMITKVNDDCETNTIAKFNDCLKNLLISKVSGYCIEQDFIEKQKYNIFDDEKCCNGEEHNAMCFKHIDLTHNNTYNFKTEYAYREINISSKYCLSVRTMINNYKKRCHSIFDCFDPKMIDAKKNIFRCIIPFSVTQKSQIIELERNQKSKFIFFGYPSEINNNIKITNYVPKLFIFPIWLIVVYETILKYTASFSLTLAILNLAPCYYLDGYLIIQYLLEIIMGSDQDNSFRPFFLHLIVGIGTFIIFTTLISALFLLYCTPYII